MSPSVQRTLAFNLLTWWHPGTGRGDGVTADAVVRKGKEDKLPFLPGRTVKGLVREACRVGAAAGVLDSATLEDLFGTGPPKQGESPEHNEFKRVRALEQARFGTKKGDLRFSSAHLGATRNEQDDWSSWARWRDREDESRVTPELYGYVSQTAICRDTGIAKDQTLRTIEVVVPMTLHAFITGSNATPWDAIDESVRLFLRTLGSHRNRGFGRVDAHLVTP